VRLSFCLRGLCTYNVMKGVGSMLLRAASHCPFIRCAKVLLLWCQFMSLTRMIRSPTWSAFLGWALLKSSTRPFFLIFWIDTGSKSVSRFNLRPSALPVASTSFCSSILISKSLSKALLCILISLSGAKFTFGSDPFASVSASMSTKLSASSGLSSTSKSRRASVPSPRFSSRS